MWLRRFWAASASSRLDEILVRNEQLAVSVSAGNSAFQRVGILSVNASVKDGVEPATLEQRLDDIIAEFIADGPTEDEVAPRCHQQSCTHDPRTGTGRRLRPGKAQTLAEGEVLSDDPAFYAREFESARNPLPDGCAGGDADLDDPPCPDRDPRTGRARCGLRRSRLGRRWRGQCR